MFDFFFGLPLTHKQRSIPNKCRVLITVENSVVTLHDMVLSHKSLYQALK